jgi:hypothetical protein
VRALIQRIPPQIAVGTVAGYLFCDSLGNVQILVYSILGWAPRWQLLNHALAPFIVILSIALAVGSRKALTLAKAYLWFQIIFEIVAGFLAPFMVWQSIIYPPVPRGATRPSFYTFSGLWLVLDIVIWISLLLLLRRSDVTRMFSVTDANDLTMRWS